jgi:glycosyltransferase involved in cell wall biosynthesis
MNLVSVIIPTYKRSQSLIRAIKSVLNQTYTNFEIIIVDDNSEISEIKKTKAIADKYQVTYLKNYRSKGGCGARNSGVLSAKGDIIAFLDDDDVFLSNKIDTQLRHLMATTAHATFTDYILNDQIYSSKRGIVQKRRQSGPKEILNFCVPASTSLMMVRKTAIMDVGLFDESLPSFQDLDLWYRLSKNGSIQKCEGLLTEFTIHSEERVSINLEKRIKGLHMIIEKWRGEIECSVGVKNFYNYYYRETLYNNIKYSNLSFMKKIRLYLKLNLSLGFKLKYLAVLPYYILKA